MFKRFSRWALLLVATMLLGVVLTACGDATTPTPAANNGQNNSAQAPTGVSSAMAASFPSTTSVYMTLNTNKGSDQIKGWQNIVKYLSNIPEVKNIFQNADLLALAQIGTYDGDVDPWIGSEVAIGITDVNPLINLATSMSGTGSSSASAAPSELPILIGTPVKDQAKAQAFITKITDKLTQAGAPAAKQDTYNGATLYTINAGFFSIVAGLSKDKLFIGGGPNLVKAALDQTADKSLASKADYKTVAGKLSTGNLAFAYVDYQSVLKTLTDNPQLKSSLGSLNSTNLDYTGSLGVTFSTADQGFRMDAYQSYIPEKTPPAVAAMLKKGNNPNKILTALPETTFAFANTRDASSSYDFVMNSLKSMNNANSQQVDKGIADFEQQSGLSIKNDIVSLFSGEFGVFATPAANKTLPVGFGLVAEESDKAAAQAKLDKISAAVEKAADGQVKFESKTSGSTTYRSFSQSGVSVNFGVVGNYAFFTVGDEATASLITAATGGKNFTNGANADRFNKLKGVLPGDNSGYFYLDIQSTVNTALGILPAEQQTQFKAYTDKLTQLQAIGAAGTQNEKEASTTVYIYFPVTK